MCGSVAIDGHAFCLGVDLLTKLLKMPVVQVTLLIRRAIFRTRQLLRDQDGTSLGIWPMGELIDAYHAHETSILHDKIYALLGLCLDNLELAGLEPNYQRPWKEFMQNLIKFVLGSQVFVKTLGG